MALGLYVHVPFCSSICNYCNFNRGLYDDALKTRYVAALIEEIGGAGDGSPVDSIFFGGGTPSLLEPGEIGSVIAACGRAFTVASDAEITIEANPETASLERMAGFRDAGVTRLSYGVQSFRDDELLRLGRVHSAERAAEAVGIARTAGFDNLSLDLMMWLPGQSVSQWLSSVDAAIALEPDHVSLYLLELYPNAPLREVMARADWSQAPDDAAADMYLDAMFRLDRAGFKQYEISNVARPGLECRHNLKYWTDQEWLGFGCGAHSTRDQTRWKNVESVTDYVAMVQRGDALGVAHRRLSDAERAEEALMTGLRLSRGVDLGAFDRDYGVDVMAAHGPDLAPFLERGILRYNVGRLTLTRTGMLLANEIMAVFIGTPRTLNVTAFVEEA
jgi:oxygen-independent coproporphyrinogen-3 oxidase